MPHFWGTIMCLIVCQNHPMHEPHPPMSPPAAQSPPAELDEVRDRIVAVDQAAEQYLHDQQPDNTTRAYTADWNLWCAYCQALGIPSRDATPGALVGFAVWMERGHHTTTGKPAAPSTIRRRLYGAVAALRARGTALSPAIATKANDAVKAYERRLASDGTRTGRGKATAVTVKQLRAICDELPHTLAGLRDRAILLLGFCLAARRDELAHLAVTDIHDDPNGLVIDVRYSKTSQRTVAVPYGSRPSTCPVRAWHAWQHAAELDDGRAFRSIDRHGHVGASITGHGVGAAITRAGDHAGLLTRITGHSLRAGLATEARRTGHDPHSIGQQGGWAGNSAVLHGYMRTVDQWDDNALNNIGL